MYLSARDIASMEGIERVHFLNPEAVCREKSLGDATGLRNLGVHWVTIPPGHAATEAHVHHYEEECVFVVSGRGTALLGERTVAIGPGDFLAYPTNGIPHQIRNEGEEPMICFVVGQRLGYEVMDFPRFAKRAYRHDGQWDIVDSAHIGNAEGGARTFLPIEPPAFAAAPEVPMPPAAKSSFHLIPIDRSGQPGENVEAIPREAADACQASSDLYRMVGFVPPWIGYLAMAEGRCVGTCAFKAPPKNRRVEIAYFTFPAYEGHGYATEMARALMNIAFESQPGILLVAHTRAEEGAPNAVLKKLGFHLAGRGYDADDGEVWEWTLQTATS